MLALERATALRDVSAILGKKAAAPPAGEDEAWWRVLLARTQEAHEGGLITDGAARALLELAPGEPLPWDRNAP